MSTPSYRDIFDHLASRGLLSDQARDEAEQEVTASEETDDSASRLISVAAGIGAWLTMVFLVVFLFAIELIDWGGVTSLVVAVLLGAAAVGAYLNDLSRGVFASQLVLATSFTAQVVAFLGMRGLDFGPRILGAAVFCASIYMLIDSRTNRLFSAALLGGWFAAETGIHEHSAIFTLLFSLAVALPCITFGARRSLPSSLRIALRPAAYVGAALALGMSFEILGEWIVEWLPMAERIILAVAASVMLTLAYLESRGPDSAHVDEPDAAEGRRFIWASAAVVVLGLFTTPGVLCSALVVGLGLWRRRIWLAALGSIALGAHLFVYYYQLDMTLLARSGVLVVSGLVLLVLRWALDSGAQKSDEKEAP